MQNHQPYLDDQGGELENYFDGIQTSNEALREFTNFLKTFDEPTILVFTGDHFPFFTPECNYYRDMGITVDNCEKLYEKTWLVWNNYDLDTSSLPKKMCIRDSCRRVGTSPPLASWTRGVAEAMASTPS